ncbi:MAG: PAS domain S-box protein [bacterium]|nr:PAS domain S-box protein [bacterium]
MAPVAFDNSSHAANSDDLLRIFEKARFGLAVLGPDLGLVRFNAAFLKITGLAADQLSGRPLTEFLSPEDIPRFREAADRVRSGGSEDSDMEARFPREDGRDGRVEIRLSRVDGPRSNLLVSAVEISRPETEVSPWAGGDERFRRLFENSRDFLFISDPEGRILEINPAATALSGYSAEELKRLRMADLYHRPEDRKVLLEKLMSRGYIENHEIRGRRKDGTTIDVLVNASVIRDETGRITGFQGSMRDISGWKRTEQALKASEERFRSLYENATIGIYRTTPDGRILLANPALVRMLGYSGFQELAGRNLKDPDFEPAYSRREFQDRMERDGTVEGLESVWKRKDGTEMHVRESARLIRGEDGRPLFYDGVAEDITVRVRTEEALKQAQTRLSGFMDSAAESIYLLDADLNFVDVNRRGLEILNLKREQIIGKNLADLLPEHRESWRYTRHLEVIRTGEPFETEDFVAHPVFGDMYFIVKAFKAGDGLGLIAHEITGRVRAEQALQSSERRFRALIENSSDAIALIDSAGIVLYHSPSYERVMGYRADERAGKSTFDLIHPEDRPRVSELLAGILRDGGRVPVPPVRVRHADGTWRWIEGVANNLIGEPAVSALVVNFRDITERKEAEKALAHSHDLMRYIIEHNRSAVAVHNREMKYIYVSQRYLDDYKVKEQDVIGKHHYDVFPDLPQKWRDVHQRVLQGAVESAEDDPYVREDGSVDWTRWECRPWYEADGSIGGLIVYTEVITERKRAETELRLAHMRNEALLAAIPDIVMEVDNRKIYTWANRAGLEFFGEDVVGKEASEYFVGEQDVYRSVRAVFEGREETVYVESWQKRKDGEKRLLAWWCRSLKDADGRVTGALSSARDITDRKRMENELMQSEALLQASQKTARMGHFIWDIGTDSVTVSRTLEEVLGIDARYPHTLEGWLGLVHPEDRARFRDSLTPAGMRELRSFDTLCRVRRPKSRKILWVQVIGHVEIDAVGNPVQFFGTIQDVTERKLAEERIQADLREKEILLKEIHHRVKNNLQVISSMLALQSKSIADPEIQAVFQSCRNRVHSIGLVHEKLYRSKSLTSVDFSEYARTMIREMMIHYDMGSRVGVKICMRPIQLDIETAIPVGLILSELVTNALKHAFPADREGTLRVDFRSYRRRFWRMAVSDDGVGLPRGKNGPGSEGFGMELIRILTEQLDGRLQVRRAKGATFTVTFPSAEASQESRKPARRKV